jgi:acyl-CoA thioesterase-1
MPIARPTTELAMTICASRRRLIAVASAAFWAAFSDPREAGAAPPGELTLYTFGDSILDSGPYNNRGLNPGRLIVRNDDALFPEFTGKDLRSRGPARLEHRAVDGATVADLPAQMRSLLPRESGIALLTIGGNDLLLGLAADTGSGVRRFETALDRFLQRLPIRPVLLGNVYDPTFGDDSRNFLRVDARIARANHGRVNAVIATLAGRYGRLVDLHAHFLRGNPSWYTQTIEPSLVGTSEIRRVFLAAIT